MARPERNDIDYFPFICKEGKTLYYLEETYGNDGFATFVKLLRELAKTNYHYLDLSKNTTLMFLSAKCKVSKETLVLIVNDLVELDKFDTVLWNENNVIWCQDFIDSIQDAYIKRKNKCITYDGLLQLLISLGVRKPPKKKPIVPSKSQSKVDESKVDESKVEIPPKLNDKKFILKWNTLLIQKKWKKKSESALIQSLEKLARYDVDFATELVENAISGDYQGVVFSDTDEFYKKRNKTINKRTPKTTEYEDQL